ncbi:HAD family phosphatase [Actinoplanes sp. NPDC051851]|uniref:HAD family hydrolase n=1 Tax=Actinoplanes sp. NPDC051851 TaxID=3154753 RepID=UPI00341E5BD6
MNETLPLSAPAGPIVFDCDGTLVGTEGVWDGAYAILFQRHHATLARADRHALIGLTLDGLGLELARLLDQPGRHQELAAETFELVSSNLGRGIPPMPGAVELVTELSGHRRMAVASNTIRSAVIDYLTGIGIHHHIDHIVGSDDVAAPKPAPDVYLHACNLLEVDPHDAIAVEDSAAGALAAKTAGLFVIGVPSQPDQPLPAADLIYPNLSDPQLRRLLRYPTPNRRIA